ncbi:protein kinase [Streptomyces polygonati]|uniref:Protein kinase n=1 Tax=Streptomyces polygonati TaxID=1617087 RepID=A0ABV8HX51_9ACTN
MRPLQAGDPTSVGQGRYRLVGRLGEGGMGVVYFGRSLSGRAVAVKVVRPELSTEPGFRRRFADEVAAARRVGGFHTAPVVDADPDGRPAWLVTAFVPGPTLQSVLVNVGALPVGTLTVLAAGLAEALEAIHRVGVMHRDLKPANIIVAEDGPRVIDFGIARALDGTALTQTGLQIGTPGYLAPEQLTGGAVTPAVDMFALGVVLSQAAGAFPFGDGPSAARHYRVVHQEPDLGGVPAELRPLIAACLAKDPADRPTPADFLSRLTVHQLPEGAWLPAEATAMLARTEPPPSNTADTYQAAAAAAGAAAPAPAGPDDPAAPAEDGPPAAAPPTPLAPRTPPERPAPPAAPDHPATVKAASLPASAYQAPPESPAAGAPIGAPPGPPAGSSYPATARVTASPDPGGAFGPPAGSYGSDGAAAGRGRRRTLLIVAAALVVAAAAGLVMARPWSGGPGGSGQAAGPASSPSAKGSAAGAPAAAALPAQPLLIREDTAPGWPSKCHGVIAVRDPGRDDPRRIISGGSCDILPVWAPDRATFAFTRSGPSSSVWVADADGSNAHRVAAISGGKVAWSPDGTRLAVTRIKDGVLQIYTVNVSDGSARQLTTGTGAVQDPEWSPDGQQLAVCIQAQPGLWQINLLKVSDPTAAPRQITHGTQRALDPVWSPDGSRLAYTYGKPLVGSQGDIHLIGADGTGDHPLAASAEEEMDPTWSPDGKWVAYVRGEIATPAVWAIRADGTGARRLTTGALPEGHPSWS